MLAGEGAPRQQRVVVEANLSRAEQELLQPDHLRVRDAVADEAVVRQRQRLREDAALEGPAQRGPVPQPRVVLGLLPAGAVPALAVGGGGEVGRDDRAGRVERLGALDDVVQHAAEQLAAAARLLALLGAEGRRGGRPQVGPRPLPRLVPVVVDPRVVQRLYRLAAPLEPRGGGRREDGAQGLVARRPPRLSQTEQRQSREDTGAGAHHVALAQEALAVELRGHRAPV